MGPLAAGGKSVEKFDLGQSVFEFLLLTKSIYAGIVNDLKREEIEEDNYNEVEVL